MPRFSNSMDKYDPQPEDKCWICGRTVKDIQRDLNFTCAEKERLMKRYYARTKVDKVIGQNNGKISIEIAREKTSKTKLVHNEIDLTFKTFEIISEEPIYVCIVCQKLMNKDITLE
ncbi:MAG: hypothetical protein ACTSSL_11495 [Candidatus Heimdallarchaeaceae archaeon]